MTDIKVYGQAVRDGLDAMANLSHAAEWLEWNGLPELISALKSAADALDKGKFNVALRMDRDITDKFNRLAIALGDHPYSRIVNKSAGEFLEASIAQGDVFAGVGERKPQSR